MIKRYFHSCDGKTYFDPEGEYVKHSDYLAQKQTSDDLLRECLTEWETLDEVHDLMKRIRVRLKEEGNE